MFEPSFFTLIALGWFGNMVAEMLWELLHQHILWTDKVSMLGFLTIKNIFCAFFGAAMLALIYGWWSFFGVFSTIFLINLIFDLRNTNI